MRRITKILVITAVGAGIVVGAAALAKRGGYGWHGDTYRAEFIVERVGNRLDLDMAQSQRLALLVDEMRELRKTLSQDRRQLGEEMVDLLSQPQLDQQRLIDIITAKTRTIDGQAPQMVAALGEFTDSLDQQQKVELMELLQRRLERGRRWHHHHDDTTTDNGVN